MFEFLPAAVRAALQHLNADGVYELRLRANKPVSINYRGEYCFLGDFGLIKSPRAALRVDKDEIEQTVYRAGRYSLYAVEEQIKRGYVTAECGQRVGLAGEYVFEKGAVLTIRNVTSLCIRIPHAVKGCSEEIYQTCLSGGLKNLLIVAPPGIGKTTILRDLTHKISKETGLNVLVCDERGELSSHELGDTCDVCRYATKALAFEAGIRAMRPDVIVTDELTDADAVAVQKAVQSGVKVLASAHGDRVETLPLALRNAFERIVLLDEKIIGKIKFFYDENLNEIGRVAYD